MVIAPNVMKNSAHALQPRLSVHSVGSAESSTLVDVSLIRHRSTNINGTSLILVFLRVATYEDQVYLVCKTSQDYSWTTSFPAQWLGRSHDDGSSCITTTIRCEMKLTRNCLSGIAKMLDFYSQFNPSPLSIKQFFDFGECSFASFLFFFPVDRRTKSSTLQREFAATCQRLFVISIFICQLRTSVSSPVYPIKRD